MWSQSIRHDLATHTNYYTQYFTISDRTDFNWIVSMMKVEKAMAPHSSTLAWKIQWAEEPGRLQSMESLRVGHD